MDLHSSCRCALVALSIASAACSGAVTASADCPAGFVCTPIAGRDAGSPVADAGTSGPSGPIGADAGVTVTPIDSGATSSEGGTTAASSSFALLPHRVVDAEWSGALSSIVMVTDTPSDTLYLYDVNAQSERSVALPSTPVSVGVDASGLFAAVAYDANVSWIDLKAGTITKTCALSSNAADVVLTTAGIAYVLPQTDQWVAIHVLDLTTCTETLSGSYQIYAGGNLALHPSGKALFDADVGLDPSRITRCDLTQSPIACADSEGQADWGTYGFCGNLWVSADGQRIYGACGATLRVPADPNASLCTYGGALEGVTLIQHLSEAPTAQQLALIPGSVTPVYPGEPGASTTADTVVSIFETNFLKSITQYALPEFPVSGGASAIAHGRFVFTTPKLDVLYVIVQADASSGALQDFAIETLIP